MRILYLHGLGSGANSRTPKLLKKYFPEYEIEAPEIPTKPSEAFVFLNQLAKKKYDLVMGTSLGAFYCLLFKGVKKLLINPALFADEDLRDRIGMGEHPYFLKRSNGEKTFVIDEPFIEKLSWIRNKIEKELTEEEKLITFGLFGSQDSLLSHYDDFVRTFGKDRALIYPGEHRITQENVENTIAPFVKYMTEDEK